MKTSRRPDSLTRGRRLSAWCGGAALLLLVGCRPTAETRWQGYLEGEYVYVASPMGGRLETLAVRRGQQVAVGDALFALDATVEQANLVGARQRLAQAQAQLDDLRKGARPSELAALTAQLTQARTAAELSDLELHRISRLFDSQVVAAEEFDRARLGHDTDLARVAQLEAQLETGRLGGRSDAIDAAAAAVAAAQSAVTSATWSVTEKAPRAPAAGLVFDTLFRPGEVVGAAQPVVALLPPENLKVRFFLPEADRVTLAAGDTVQVALSGHDQPVPAKITYLSPQPEFTPPVLYNRENRAKLVFMVEAVFAADAAVELLPGQPVDVSR